MKNRIYKRALTILDALASAATTGDQHEKLLKWFLRYNDNESVRRALEERWAGDVASGREDKAAAAAWERTRKALGLPQDDDARRERYRRDLAGRVERRRKIALRRRVAWRVAAVAIPFVVVVGAVFLMDRGEGTAPDMAGRTEQPFQAEPTARMTVMAPVDTVRVHIMPDRSKATVAPGSTLRHAESFGDGRRVELEGRAYFNVERDTARPFTVHTRHLVVAVLGTDFSVSSPAGEDHSIVELFHGRVNVTAGDETAVMSPGDRLRFDHTARQITLSRLDIAERVYKRMPGMRFEGSSLADIFGVLESDYGVTVEVGAGVSTSEKDIVADFTRSHSLDEVMRLLSKTSGKFAYEIAGSKIIIKENDR